MSVNRWQPGKLYHPGALVLPRTDISDAWPVLGNPGFDSGDFTSWNVVNPGNQGAVTVSNARPFQGAYSAFWRGVNVGGNRRQGLGMELINTVEAAVRPGQVVTAAAMLAQDDTRNSQNRGHVRIYWYDESRTLINHSRAARDVAGNYSHYENSSVTAQAPARARYARMGAWLQANAEGGMRMDACQWTSQVPSRTAGLMYRAVGAEPGHSAATEPTWPPQQGEQVTDGEVTWEAVLISRIVWRAVPLLVSGAVEPTWPTRVGATVIDNSIAWEVVARQVTDPKCPQSKTVVIAASKVFAADGDIIPFSATANPLDWSSPDNAGFLPSGLQLYGANPIEAMGLYRGNLVAMNVQGSQVWQVDEDPALMALLDAFPIGSQHHKAIAPVSNDLFVLTQLGVRTLGVAAGATNLQAGDVGQPVDPMVQAALDAALADGAEPFGLYNPNAGQYWLGFKGGTASTGHFFVYTMNRMGQAGAWTRYEFPWRVDDWCIKGEHLYLRHGDEVSRIDMNRESDGGTPFEWFIQWPWLDFGQMGVTKMMQGFDIIGTGVAKIEFGYDQTNGGRWTPAWELIADSVPGQLLPMPLAAPSIAVRLTYQGSDVERTGWEALNLHFAHFRETS